MLIGVTNTHSCNALKQLTQLSACDYTSYHGMWFHLLSNSDCFLAKLPVDVAERLNQAYAITECATLHKLPQVVARMGNPVSSIFHGSLEVCQLLACYDCEATMYSPDHSCKGWCELLLSEHSTTHGIDGMLNATAGPHAACKTGMCIPDAKTMC